MIVRPNDPYFFSEANGQPYICMLSLTDHVLFHFSHCCG